MFGTQDTRIDDVVEALCTGGEDDVIEDVPGCSRMKKYSMYKDVLGCKRCSR